MTSSFPAERVVSRKLKQITKGIIPQVIYRPILNWWRSPRPVHWGSLRCLKPVSSVFGFDRGLSIDRYYIEAFLQGHRSDIRGSSIGNRRSLVHTKVWWKSCHLR